MRPRQARKNLWASLPSRLAGLTGDLTAQLAADLEAVRTERRPSRAPTRYAPLPRADWWLNTRRAGSAGCGRRTGG